jgi:hypothetical protein
MNRHERRQAETEARKQGKLPLPAEGATGHLAVRT